MRIIIYFPCRPWYYLKGRWYEMRAQEILAKHSPADMTLEQMKEFNRLQCAFYNAQHCGRKAKAGVQPWLYSPWQRRKWV